MRSRERRLLIERSGGGGVRSQRRGDYLREEVVVVRVTVCTSLARRLRSGDGDILLPEAVDDDTFFETVVFVPVDL